MIKIKVPATTSNLAVGFDTLGMALNLYNEFGFAQSEQFLLDGFSEELVDDNLVLNAYKAFHEAYEIKEVKPVKISLLRQQVPIAKGLGSSATCIIAGVLAANQISGLGLSLHECANFASTIEGHPDNVFSAVLGGLNATFDDEGVFVNQPLELSEKLHFALLIPQTIGPTEIMRGILPKEVPLADAVYHISRMAVLPKALATGDMALLAKVLKDRLHQIYRGEYIIDYEEILATAQANHIICTISGSGPSLFLISDRDDFRCFDTYFTSYQIQPVKPCQGVTIEIDE